MRKWIPLWSLCVKRLAEARSAKLLAWLSLIEGLRKRTNVSGPFPQLWQLRFRNINHCVLCILKILILKLWFYSDKVVSKLSLNSSIVRKDHKMMIWDTWNSGTAFSWKKHQVHGDKMFTIYYTKKTRQPLKLGQSRVDMGHSSLLIRPKSTNHTLITIHRQHFYICTEIRGMPANSMSMWH